MMGFILAVLFGFLIIWLIEYVKFFYNLKSFTKQITCCDYSIHRVSSDFSNHLFHTCKRYLPDTWKNRNRYFKVIFEQELDDDEDVFGKQYLVTYGDQIFGMKYVINVARFKFYYDKPYKNKKEILLWLDKDAFPEQNYFAKLAKKLTMDSIQSRLKKKSRASAK